MTDLGRWLPTAFGVLTAVALVQNVAIAKSAPEINQIAQAITVRVAFGKGNGSGILLQRDGDAYESISYNRREDILKQNPDSLFPPMIRRSSQGLTSNNLEI
jgi:hypothetical protein